MSRALLLALALGAGLAQGAAPRLAVEVEGLEGEARDNVLAFLSIQQYRDSAELSDASVERLHARAPDEVRAALRPLGYYRPKVEASLAEVEGGWRARYLIAPGEPVRFAGFDVAVGGPGRDAAGFARAIEGSPLELGAPARHADYEALKRALLAAAEDDGYLEARFATSALEVDPAAGTARVRLALETGERTFFGEVTFDQSVVSPELLARYVEIRAGEPYSVRRLLELQYALNDSDYFRLVDVAPQREAIDAQRRVPIVVRLTARERQRWTFGFGYGTDTGPRGSIGYEDRRLNAAGHRGSVELSDSEVKTEVTFRYTIPLARPASERLGFEAKLVEEDLGDTQSRRQQLGASLSKTFGALRQVSYMSYDQERSDLPSGPDLRSSLLVGGTTFSQRRSDSPLYATRGYRWSFDAHGAHDSLLSDLTFLQYRVEGKAIWPLDDRSRLLVRGEYARSLFAALDALPTSQRLFAGGDQSVRGYGYDSLGDTDVDGKVIGGTRMFSAGVEVDRMFSERWGAAAFVDLGDASASSSLSPKVGAGVGLRWRSPIGLLRLDVGWALDSDIGGWHLHFAIGPEL
jgi:translocation and assembly module TamA